MTTQSDQSMDRSMDQSKLQLPSLSSDELTVPRMLPESTSIVIVGGGPVGLASALLLARYGLDVVILERHPGRLGQPKSHVMNSRTLEIFRQMGIEMLSVREAGLSPEEAKAIMFASSMTGPEFGSLVRDETADGILNITPEPTLNIPQPFIEDLLLKHALKTGKVTYLRMHEWRGCIEDTDKIITSSVLLRTSNTTQTIRSRYLIGCDGTNATTRDVLRIPFKTLDNQPEVVLYHVSVHFSADLSHLKPALLWFILNPTGMGVFIAYNRKNSWVFTISYNPLFTPKETFTSDYCKEAVFKAVGTEVEDYKELGITLWRTTPKLAKAYRSEAISHAFLSGDAAHSFPPTGGLGLNTGIADAQNLAWKIYAVEKGWATESLLNSVNSERWPVAMENSRQSKINETKIHRLVGMIFKPGFTAENLAADPDSQKEIKEIIDDQLEHFSSINLAIGYVYGRELTRGPSHYQKESVPGARLPHDWIESKGKIISTLDLVDGFSFVLITSDGFTTLKEFKVKEAPITVAQLNKEFTDPSAEWSSLMGLTQTRAGVLVRPDQHIVGTVGALEEVEALLSSYLSAQ